MISKQWRGSFQSNSSHSTPPLNASATPTTLRNSNVPNGFLHRETNTRITSNLDVLKLLATHGGENRSIVFHDRHHWTRLVPRFQLVAMIWVALELCTDSSHPFWIRLIDFGVTYAFSYVPELIMDLLERDRRNKVKDSIRSYGFADEKRLAELCEIHDYNQFKILKDLFKE